MLLAYYCYYMVSKKAYLHTFLDMLSHFCQVHIFGNVFIQGWVCAWSKLLTKHYSECGCHPAFKHGDKLGSATHWGAGNGLAIHEFSENWTHTEIMAPQQSPNEQNYSCQRSQLCKCWCPKIKSYTLKTKIHQKKSINLKQSMLGVVRLKKVV